MAISWKNVADLTAKSYVCGYCSNSIASQKGFFGEDDNRRHNSSRWTVLGSEATQR